MVPTGKDATKQPTGGPRERRADTRFPMALEVRYSAPQGEGGSGRLIDIGRTGLRFVAPGPRENGRRMDVAINWPVLLEGRVQLQLVVTGTVVRSSGSETVLRISRHAFRTRSAGPGAAPPRSWPGLDRSAPETLFANCDFRGKKTV